MEHRHYVLLVEDEIPIRDLLATLLREEGYEVQEVADGAAAIRVLEDDPDPASHVCVILLDMMLPRVDGVGVLHYLANNAIYLPVVAMSASSEHLHAARAAGAQAVVPKPFDIERLLATVDRACGRRAHGSAPAGRAT